MLIVGGIFRKCHLRRNGYLDLRKFGGCKHAGFGIGFDRFIMYLSGIENIRDVAPFPRTYRNMEY